ncbi:class I SAM-dependent methyltransferase [Patescibacteria group bacterium]
MDKKYAEYLINRTKEDYNLIAEDFSKTRDYLSIEMKFFGKDIQRGDKVLDLGCGNGRFSEVLVYKNAEYVGMDNSEKLIEIAQKRYPQTKFIMSSVFNLPFSDNYFDKIFSFATLHHIPSKELREQFFKETKRVLKPGGSFVLTVWDLNPLRMLLIGKTERTVKFLKYLILKLFRKSKLDFNDFFIPWKKDCQRYIHCFSKSELKRLAEKSGFKIKEIGISKKQKTEERNIYIITEKI